MELENTTCCGCLSTDRKLEPINDYLIQCYSNIIDKVPPHQNGFPISLCWQCAALLKKFTRFKHQVLQCYDALLECSKMNFCNKYNTKSTLQRLQIQKVINITILPEDTLVDKTEFSVELIKTDSFELEDNTDNVSVKEEVDSFDDDDTALIVMAQKKKKDTKKSKKRQKQKDIGEEEMYTEIELTRTELEEERRLLLDREEYVNAMFKCENCILPFPNEDDLKDHMTLKHDENPSKYKCPICDVSLATLVSYSYHRNKHARRYQCARCGERLASKRAAAKHYRAAHSLATLVSYSYHRNKHARRYQCARCGERLASKRAAATHYRVAHSYHRNKHARRYQCARCGERLASKRAAATHYRAAHSYHRNKHARRYQCARCGERLASKRAAAKHYRAAHSYHRNKHARRYRCARCGERLASKRAAAKHYRAAHSYICEVSLAMLVSYSYHRNKHARRYQCARCGERLASKRAAATHYRAVHRTKTEKDTNSSQNSNESLDNVNNSQEDSVKSEASFPCSFCEKSFRWSTSLRKHVEAHKIQAGEKRRPYCEPCKLSFTNTSNLQKHVKSSSKHQIQLRMLKLNGATLEPALERQVRRSVNVSRAQHACPHCGAKYQWRGNLLRHLQTHAARAKGELVCEPCNRTFSSIATYQQHMAASKRHVTENDFKFPCSECGKKFANKTRLRDHVNWDHLKNYVHNCQVCQKVFKSHTSLYLHEQVVHRKGRADHLCDHCGKPFPNQAKLRCHIAAVHSGEAPYKCGSCAARFSWHSCLSRHVRRVHSKKHVS